MSGHVEFDPAAAGDVAQRLDMLAGRLERNLAESAQALSTVPAGIDDVSRRATHTFNSVNTQYQHAYRNGVHELRKLAANMRSHSHTFQNVDADSAATFGQA